MKKWYTADQAAEDLVEVDNKLASIEDRATTLGRDYIELIMAHDLLQAISSNQIQPYIQRWQDAQHNTRVSPTFQELVVYECTMVLRDRKYVESTMKSMTHLVGKRVNKMWLLVDDVRDLDTEAVARTPEVAKKLLSAGGWDCLCLDHDLGAEETGHDILNWALTYGYVPPKVVLVTENIEGRTAMARTLEMHGYQTKNGTDFEFFP